MMRKKLNISELKKRNFDKQTYQHKFEYKEDDDLNLFMEDVPVTVLLGTVSASIKIVES